MRVNVVIKIFKLVVSQTDRWDNFSKALSCSVHLASTYRVEVGIPVHSELRTSRAASGSPGEAEGL